MRSRRRPDSVHPPAIVVVALLVLPTAFTLACASAPKQPPVPPDDHRISTEVWQRLDDDGHIDAAQIVVESREGVVVLSGVAASRGQVRRALRVAGKVAGVRQVINRLRVLPQE